MTREQALAAGGDAPGYLYSAGGSYAWASARSVVGQRCADVLQAGETSAVLVDPPGRVEIDNIERVGRWAMTRKASFSR